MNDQSELRKTFITHKLTSNFLQREVIIDCYLPSVLNQEVNLLLINDGQDLIKFDFNNIISQFQSKNEAMMFCVGIHCAVDRKNEYGTANILDYKGRGAKAALYTKFIFNELIPFIRTTYKIFSFKEKSFAGFSLGGLCALDIVWNHPYEFSKVGVFSGSLWWRDKSQDDPDFNEDTDRIMHKQIREGAYYPWLKFFFEVGTQDETADRNNNGIIDSIDDTQNLIDELKMKGYKYEDIKYLELAEGRHDIETWALAFPDFLAWGWGKGSTQRAQR